MSHQPLENPWLEEAQHLLGNVAGSWPRTAARIASALARAYEYGHAQGRLAEIDRRNEARGANWRELPEGPKP